MLNSRGLLARMFRPVFRLVSSSWRMFPIGFLFGLGFDTATEAALLGITATQAAQGMSVWSIMVFPALFAAGMSLIDTTDGVLMLPDRPPVLPKSAPSFAATTRRRAG